MTEHTTDDSDRATQAAFEAMERDPIGFAREFDQMVRLQYLASGSKPSMEAAGLFHGSVQLSLRLKAQEVALGTLPLLLDTFSRATDLHPGHTDQLAQLAEELQEMECYDGAVKILDIVVCVRQRFFGAEHAGTWTAQANLAEALRKAGQLDRAQKEIGTAIRIWEASKKTTINSAMRKNIEVLLHSIAGVIAQEANN
ncbi:MAG: hypothetical protein ACRD2L_05445, partial [Terriglobia bacterium]